MALRITVTGERSFSRTLHLAGRLDNETSAALDLEVDKLTDSAVTVLAIDLGDLEYISSAGLRVIFRAKRVMAERAGRIVLVNAQPQVQKVFDIAKAADLGAVFASVQELDAYLDTMQRKVLDGK